MIYSVFLDGRVSKIRIAKTSADYLGSIRDDNKGRRVYAVHIRPKFDGLGAVENNGNYLALVAGIGAVRSDDGAAAVDVFKNKLLDLVRAASDDFDFFTHVEALDNDIDDETFQHETEYRIKAGPDAEGEYGGGGDGKIGDQQRFADMQMRVARKYPRHNIGAACGGILIEHDRRANGGESDGEHQLEHGVAGNGMIELYQYLACPDEKRQSKARIHRFYAEVLAQHQKADDVEHTVYDEHKNADIELRAVLCEYDRDAAYASNCEAVGRLEKDYARGGKQQADVHKQELFQLLALFYHSSHIRISLIFCEQCQYSTILYFNTVPVSSKHFITKLRREKTDKLKSGQEGIFTHPDLLNEVPRPVFYFRVYLADVAAYRAGRQQLDVPEQPQRAYRRPKFRLFI